MLWFWPCTYLSFCSAKFTLKRKKMNLVVNTKHSLVFFRCPLYVFIPSGCSMQHELFSFTYLILISSYGSLTTSRESDQHLFHRCYREVPDLAGTICFFRRVMCEPPTTYGFILITNNYTIFNFWLQLSSTLRFNFTSKCN